MEIQLLVLQTHQGTAMALATVASLVDGMQIRGIAQIAGSRDITIWIAPAISKPTLLTVSKIVDGMIHLCLLLQDQQQRELYAANVTSLASC